MLIDFRQLFPKYNIRPKGVLHVGANIGEEAPVYDQLGIKNVIWIEGNPEIYERLCNNVCKYPGQLAYNYCIGETEGDSVLHISNNGSQSSSILPLGTHKQQHPEVHYTHDVSVTLKRIDNIFDSLSGYDFLNVDLQGAELMCLKGMGKLIEGFRWAYLEVNRDQVYQGCPHVMDIDSYLDKYGFRRVETKWVGNWGDALYIK